LLTRSRRCFDRRVRRATDAHAECKSARARTRSSIWLWGKARAFLCTLHISTFLAISACAESTMGEELQPPTDAGDVGDGVHVRFDLSDGKLPFGAVPWPDDLYLQDARLALGSLPDSTMPTDYARVLHGSLPELDGYGVATPIYFFLDGAIDGDTLPHSAVESEGVRAGVFLIDADTASPDAFERVRVETHWSPELSRLELRPALGHPLTPGRRYAAIVTRKVKDKRGQPLQPAPKFAAVRDATSTLSDPALQRARASYAPVLETLDKSGMLPRADVVAMAVFRVQTANEDLADARTLVRSREAPSASNVEAFVEEELDAVFGDPEKDAAAVPHDHLDAIIQGTLSSPNLLSKTAKTHGAWVREDGALEVKRPEEEVPFTLFLPKGDGTGGSTPLVIYQHALGHERSDAVHVADGLAARNIAVIAIDAPFQGMRAKSGEGGSVDMRNRFTGVTEPDRFGDVDGDFYGQRDMQALLIEFHPFYIRDALRQGVVDLMSLVRFLESEQLPGLLARVGLSRTMDIRRLGFVGEDIGATMGIMLASFEPRLQALTLVGASAFVAQGFWLAAGEQPLFETLAGWLGRSAVGIDYDSDTPFLWPELALFETLLGRAEPLAYATLLRRQPVNVLLMMARDDEVVANLATESLAVSLGAQILSGEARSVGELERHPSAAGDTVYGNVPIMGGEVTRLVRAYDPADHRVLHTDRGQRDYQTPVRPPFVSLDATEPFDNPRKAAQQDLEQYFASFFKCVTGNSSTVALPCSAEVVAP